MTVLRPAFKSILKGGFMSTGMKGFIRITVDAIVHGVILALVVIVASRMGWM